MVVYSVAFCNFGVVIGTLKKVVGLIIKKDLHTASQFFVCLFLLVILCLFNFFHQVAATITVHPGFIPVFAKLFRNIFLIEVVTDHSEIT